MKKQLILILLIVSFNPIFSQVDKKNSQLDSHTRSTLIKKGRSVLMDYFLEGNLEKVKETKDYLLTLQDKNYKALFNNELLLILYWTKEIDSIPDLVLDYSIEYRNTDFMIYPDYDVLYFKLRNATYQYMIPIIEMVQNSSLDIETRQMEILLLYYLIQKEDEKNYNQNELNKLANNYLDKYPDGIYNEFVRKYIRIQYKRKNWGFGVEFFTGYGIYTGSLSEKYTNPFAFGVAFDITYKKFELTLRDHLAWSRSKEDMQYSTGTYDEGSTIFIVIPEASFGYPVFENDRLKAAPFVGVASMFIGAPSHKTKNDPDLEEINLNFTTTWAIGVGFDLKLGRNKHVTHYPKSEYAYIRLRYSYLMPQYHWHYPGVTGGMHNITIGIGVLSRGIKRKF